MYNMYIGNIRVMVNGNILQLYCLSQHALSSRGGFGIGWVERIQGYLHSPFAEGYNLDQIQVDIIYDVDIV